MNAGAQCAPLQAGGRGWSSRLVLPEACVALGHGDVCAPGHGGTGYRHLVGPRGRLPTPLPVSRLRMQSHTKGCQNERPPNSSFWHWGVAAPSRNPWLGRRAPSSPYRWDTAPYGGHAARPGREDQSPQPRPLLPRSHPAQLRGLIQACGKRSRAGVEAAVGTRGPRASGMP